MASVLILLLALAACGGSAATTPAGGNQRPVIQEQSKPLRAPDTPYRTVVPGDTLYSIAWENGRDYRELARWNRISAPYTIKPGQKLRVVPPESKLNPESIQPTSEATIPASVSRAPPADKSSSRPLKAGPAQNDKPAQMKGSANTNTKPGNAKSTTTIARTATGPREWSAAPGRWSWPTDGKVVNRYHKSESKGLDIVGTRGEPIRAVADGRVVYQGSGLRGYGQLIIIKHNDEFLSAYAHNDRIHVKEGEAVKRGQKIADMGSTGTDRVKLHFEIRRHGAPVDPLKYLPRR